MILITNNNNDDKNNDDQYWMVQVGTTPSVSGNYYIMGIAAIQYHLKRSSCKLSVQSLKCWQIWTMTFEYPSLQGRESIVALSLMWEMCNDEPPAIEGKESIFGSI